MVFILVLVGALTGHLHAKQVISSLEKLVIVRTYFWALGDSHKAPSVQLAGKTGVLRFLKISRKDFGHELFFLVNNECLAVRKPRYYVFVCLVIQNFH